MNALSHQNTKHAHAHAHTHTYTQRRLTYLHPLEPSAKVRSLMHPRIDNLADGSMVHEGQRQVAERMEAHHTTIGATHMWERNAREQVTSKHKRAKVCDQKPAAFQTNRAKQSKQKA